MPETAYDAVQPDDEISLLDLLATLTENLRLLILGPLLAGLVALGIGFVIPPTYESRSVLRLGETVTSVLASDDLLAPLLPLAPWIAANTPRTVQLQSLRQDIKGTFNKKENVLTLVVQGPSAESAQRLHLAVIEGLRKELMPKGRDLEDIQKRRQIAEATLEDLNTVLPNLSKSITRMSADSEASSRAYSLLLQQRLSSLEALQGIDKSLKPFGDEAVVQAPTRPDRPTQPKKALIAVVSTLAVGFALLLFVFIRQALRNAAKNPDDAGRLAAIQGNLARSIGLGRK